MPFVRIVRDPPGCMRRRIEMAAAAGSAWAALEDDFHCFRITIEHDGSKVTRTRAEGQRTPWATCASAGDELEKLIGMPLATDSTAVTEFADIRHQCTHQFDLAGFAVAAAARGLAFRRYDLTVDDPPVADQTAAVEARLERDDGFTLCWTIRESTIVGPAPWSGVSIRKGFAEWMRDKVDSDTREGAMALRRCIMIARGRQHDIDQRISAAESPNAGGCWVNQPVRAALGTRIRGSTFDFARRKDDLLAVFRLDDRTTSVSPDAGFRVVARDLGELQPGISLDKTADLLERVEGAQSNSEAVRADQRLQRR